MQIIILMCNSKSVGQEIKFQEVEKGDQKVFFIRRSNYLPFLRRSKVYINIRSPEKFVSHKDDQATTLIMISKVYKHYLDF